MYNITKEDYEEIHKVTELTSDAGEKTRAWVDEKVTFITRKNNSDCRGGASGCWFLRHWVFGKEGEVDDK